MPGQQQQQATTQQIAPTSGGPDTTQLSAQSRFGNAYLQEQLKSRQSPGALTWKAALGEKLGGKLYGALSAQLTDEKLSGHAAKAVDAALAQVRKALEGQVKPSEEEAVQLFLAEIDKQVTGLATEAVTASGLSQGIRDYADVHPYEIALAAIAGAVAYVASNQDLPLLEAKLGLGGDHSLVGGIDPGRTMKLAVEQLRVGYRYQGDHVAAYLNADKFQNGYGIAGGAQYTNGDRQMGISGSHTERDGKRTSRLDLSYQDADMQAGLGLQGSTGNPSSVTASIADRPQPGQLQRSLRGPYRDDGSWEAAAGIGQQKKSSGWQVEAFAGEDARGNRDSGVRALFKLSF